MAVCKVAHFRALEDGSEVYVAVGQDVPGATDEAMFDIPAPAPKPQGRKAASA